MTVYVVFSTRVTPDGRQAIRVPISERCGEQGA